MESATIKKVLVPAIARRSFIAPTTWLTSARGAVEDPGVDGDTAVGGHREPGLDLFQIQAPVLGMPV
ncbi:hypothetical protein, partial [Streptomyces sp. AB3(2024)]|uniref:hypothetical protein n=1 Tax=Streptomyces sp. AB3(2024) TaxID=3317321 RepID=UPI0035A2BFE4